MSEARSREPAYLLGVDFGSTYLDVKIYNEIAELVTGTSVKIPYVYPTPDAVEIEPYALWDLFVDVVTATFTKSDLSPRDIKGFGISCQRGTLMLWEKTTGQPLYNLISWQDKRCAGTVDSYNKSWMLKTINVLGAILYAFLRTNKFLLMKVLQFQMNHGMMKIAWLLETNEEVRDAVDNDRVYFGALDSWIVWKLTNGKHHVTDLSNASGTAFFDPYTLDWSILAWKCLGTPLTMFPSLCSTSAHICDVDEEIFGSTFPLTALVADTQAATFGQRCFDPGQVSCTLGTGSFFTINTGTYAHASVQGLYPQVGWSIDDDINYLCESYISSIGTSIEWAKNLGLFNDVSETANIARSVLDTDGVYFVPGFFGLSAPYQDPAACCSLIGVKHSTRKEHLVRAVLEGIAFRFYEMHKVVLDETKMPPHPVLRLCGGVTNNDFIMELISSLTKQKLEVSHESGMSLMGAVYLAGLGACIWTKDDIMKFNRPITRYEPNDKLTEKYGPIFSKWQSAVKRSLNWYKE